jgi:hypothetical protein
MPIHDLTDQTLAPSELDLASTEDQRERVLAYGQVLLHMQPPVGLNPNLAALLRGPVPTTPDEAMKGLEQVLLGADKAAEQREQLAKSRKDALDDNVKWAGAELEEFTKSMVLPVPLLLGVAAALMSRKDQLAFQGATLPFDVALLLVMIAVCLAVLQCARLAFSIGEILRLSAPKSLPRPQKLKDVLERHVSVVNPFAAPLPDRPAEGEGKMALVTRKVSVMLTRLVPITCCALLLGGFAGLLLLLAVPAGGAGGFWHQVGAVSSRLPQALLSRDGLLAAGVAVSSFVAVAGIGLVLWRLGRGSASVGLWALSILGVLVGLGAGATVVERRAQAEAASAAKTVFECTFTANAAPACSPKP